jgi:hypothetical protein
MNPKFLLKTCCLLASYLFVAPTNAGADIWKRTEVGQTPPFDPVHPDRFDCPPEILLERNGKSLALNYNTPQKDSFLEIDATNTKRQCQKIDIHGGIFSKGRQCSQSYFQDVQACQGEVAADPAQAAQEIFQVDVCRNDFPIPCYRTDYRWTVALKGDWMQVTFDCVRCARTLKQGVCQYNRGL